MRSVLFLIYFLFFSFMPPEYMFFIFFFIFACIHLRHLYNLIFLKFYFCWISNVLMSPSSCSILEKPIAIIIIIIIASNSNSSASHHCYSTWRGFYFWLLWLFSFFENKRCNYCSIAILRSLKRIDKKNIKMPTKTTVNNFLDSIRF